MLLIDVGLFLGEGEGFYLVPVHTNGARAKVKANTIRVHEWSTDYAVVPVNIDEIKVHLVFDVAYIDWYLSAVADLRSATYTS